MNQPYDPNRTVDEAPSAPADSLDAGLAAGFGRPAAPRSSLGDLRPVLLKEAEGESAHIVKPHSDAMPPREQTGDRYRLDGEIARGGMGAVLRGRDVDLGRDLAIKVLLEKHANRPEVARRFVEEAQIGGQLQHPGVMPVYDIGRFGDRPFFTMKLVKGQTLAYLLEERADASADRPRLLGIALKVSETLAYAHAKGVIHRDLKPANIMVGAFGEVQVVDWGLAKVLAEGGIADEERANRAHQQEEGTQIRTARSSGTSGHGTDTEAGSLLGTPAYMPPEQANGLVERVDRRADVFGLGAILCEILTGKPPYVGRSGEEVRRKAANGDQADAMARLDSCGADNELIVLTKKCLAPEAIDRLKDAQEVANGLSTYLNGVQERLRRAELAEVEARARATEEARRRRLTVALAATVLLAVGLGGGGWLYVKNERDARTAHATREISAAVNQATALREQASLATVGVPALFAQAREQTQRALALAESAPVEQSLREEVYRLQAELDEQEKDQKLVATLESARLAQADRHESENRFAIERAAPLYREALRAYGMAAGEGSVEAAAKRIRERPTRVREELLATLSEWIDLAANPRQGLYEPHLDWLRGVAGAAEADSPWARQFRAAGGTRDANKRSAALEKLAEESEVSKLPASALLRLARALQAVQSKGSAVALLQRAQREHPGDFWLNHELGSALRKGDGPDHAEAVRYLTATVALRPGSAGAHLNLGLALYDRGHVDEAIACYHKAIALDPKYAAAHNNLGIALADKGQMDEAIACCRKAIALDPKFAMAHLNLGNALKGKGEVDEAIACYRKAIALDPKYAVAHNNLGAAMKDKGQVDEAIACCRKAIALDPKFAMAHDNLGNALKGKGQRDEAIACYRKAIALDPKYALAHNNLGAALRGKGQVDEAIACFRKAIALDSKYAVIHLNLGNVLKGKGEVDEAIACYRKAIALDPKLAMAHDNLGNALKGKGEVDEAIACFRKAIALGSKFAMAHLNLGNALKGKGEVDEAIACFRKAIALDPKYAASHNNLGIALADKGQMDEAIACFRKAIALDPKFAAAHNNLGVELRGKGEVDEAIACYRKAIALDPKFAAAHCNLGHVLARQGRFAESLASMKRGHELGTTQRGWSFPSAAWVRQAEAKAALEAKLLALLKGELQPKDNTERLALAGVCQIKKLHHTATGLYVAAFAADPMLADDLKAGSRYNAACFASLAAAGKAEDAARLDDAERARFRKQALDWLRADLVLRTKQLETGKPADCADVQQAMLHWQKDTDLADIRDKTALAKLPADERAAYDTFWSEVATLLKKAQEKPE